MGQRIEIGAREITNLGKRYYKSGQELKIGAEQTLSKVFYYVKFSKHLLSRAPLEENLHNND